MSTMETAINKRGIARWIPFPLPASASAQQEPPRQSRGLDGAADATGAPQIPPRRHTPGELLIRYVPPIGLITQTSFLRAAKPIWGHAGSCSVLLSHVREITRRDAAAPE